MRDNKRKEKEYEHNEENHGGVLTLDVTIPPNTSATVHIPSADIRNVTEGGKPAELAQGVKYLRTEGSSAVLAVGGGSYHFVSPILNEKRD